ncbi:hypothetical protein JEU22_14110 [Pseudomonas putida]|uniref:Enolase C-terminal TIM barrel domain-containing protein n=1 Tax=Pseudomonas putida TaxID=303 RepID=A0A8I1EEB1_PSEPU|nr:hypothetical protein [Pseudomonas putida]
MVSVTLFLSSAPESAAFPHRRYTDGADRGLHRGNFPGSTEGISITDLSVATSTGQINACTCVVDRGAKYSMLRIEDAIHAHPLCSALMLPERPLWLT